MTISLIFNLFSVFRCWTCIHRVPAGGDAVAHRTSLGGALHANAHQPWTRNSGTFLPTTYVVQGKFSQMFVCPHQGGVWGVVHLGLDTPGPCTSMYVFGERDPTFLVTCLIGDPLIYDHVFL